MRHLYTSSPSPHFQKKIRSTVFANWPFDSLSFNFRSGHYLVVYVVALFVACEHEQYSTGNAG